MTDATGTSTYEYNGNNWLLSIEKDGEPQISYEYDKIGNIISITDRLGNRTEYTYDKSSRMETVSFEGRTIAYKYDENGNRESISYDGEVEETYSYDKNNRLLELVNKKAGGSKISGYSYTYDKAGRQTSKTDSYGKTEYSYDKAGRILKVESPGKTTVYSYDGAGNRISQDETYTSEQVIPAIDGTGISEIKYIVKRSEYVYSNANRLLKLVEKLKSDVGTELMQRITSLKYDSNGNELRRSVEYITLYNKANPKAYEAAVYGEDTTEPIHAVVEQTASKYDGFNRLVRTEIIKATVKITVEYTYDGDGLRTQKTVRRSDKGNTPEVTSYLYDRQHVILETRDREEMRYVRGINYIARIDSTDKLSYYLYNGHGDVVQTVSESGEIENQYDYDIFGNPTLTVESYVNSIRYAGEYCDSETGLYYLRARYYDPYIGRFISEDSYWGEDTNPLSLNLYTYAYNDPVRYIDPSGHLPIVEDNVVYNPHTGNVIDTRTGETKKLRDYDSDKREEQRKRKQQEEEEKRRKQEQRKERERIEKKLREFRSALEKAIQAKEKSMVDKLKEQMDDLDKEIENYSKIDGVGAEEIKSRIIPELGTTLSKETKGYNVYVDLMQYKLNKLGYTGANGRKLAEDGKFGKNTEYAVNKFKEENKLWNHDQYKGKAGQTTYDMLFSGKAKRASERKKDENSGQNTGFNPPEGTTPKNTNTDIPGGTIGLVDSSYADIVTSKLSRADEFVKILGDDGVKYYGGYQEWYEKYTQRSGGCGPVAAANIAAYLALYNGNAENLFKDKLNAVDQSEFEKLMKLMYKYVNPNEIPIVNVASDLKGNGINFGKIEIPPTTGVWPLSKFSEGVVKYAEKMGVKLTANVYDNDDLSLNDALNKIKEALKADSPVALFNGFDAVKMNYEDPQTKKNINYDYKLHWVTITSVTENKNTGDVTATVSTWGGKATLSLTDLWNKKSDIVSPGIVYFNVDK